MVWLPRSGAGYKDFSVSGSFATALIGEELVKISMRGTAALVVAAAATWMPAYRWFLLISMGIGAGTAGGLYLWHKLRPVKDDDVENKQSSRTQLERRGCTQN